MELIEELPLELSMFNRITDGMCTEQEDKRPRIENTNRKHGGDDGTSLLLNGVRISKAHKACALYGSVEELQQAISECLYFNNGNIFSEEVEQTLVWLFRNLFSLSSFCFCKADSERHKLPERFLDYLEGSIGIMANEVGSAQDFLVTSHISLLQFNKVRIAVRKVESSYVAWKETDEMTRYLFNNPHLIEGVRLHSIILNRLSTWLFWVMRMQGLYLQDKGILLTEVYWQSQAEPFPY